jgi:hypothetical protein
LDQLFHFTTGDTFKAKTTAQEDVCVATACTDHLWLVAHENVVTDDGIDFEEFVEIFNHYSLELAGYDL